MEINVWREAKSKVSCLEEAVASSEEKTGGEGKEGGDGQIPAGLRAWVTGERGEGSGGTAGSRAH